MTCCLNTLCLGLPKYAIFERNDPGNFSPSGIQVIIGVMLRGSTERDNVSQCQM